MALLQQLPHLLELLRVKPIARLPVRGPPLEHQPSFAQLTQGFFSLFQSLPNSNLEQPPTYDAFNRIFRFGMSV